VAPGGAAVTHDQIVARIQARATARGLRTHYCRKSVTCAGDRGLPDLFLCGPGGAGWIEVKTPGDPLEPGQTAWRYMLIAAAQFYEIMYEKDLGSGHAVDQFIGQLTTLTG
jgi:hypothetical protein